MSTSETILFIYASNLCVRLCVWPSIYPSIEIPSLKALTVLRCISLFCLSTSSILIRIEINSFIYASKLCIQLCVWPSIYPSIHPSRSLLLKLWLCCGVQTCFHCPLPPSWSGWMMTSLYSFMRPSYVPSSLWPASHRPDPFSYTFDYTVMYKSVLFVLFQHLDQD